jgi:hypothetical protein
LIQVDGFIEMADTWRISPIGRAAWAANGAGRPQLGNLVGSCRYRSCSTPRAEQGQQTTYSKAREMDLRVANDCSAPLRVVEALVPSGG